MNKVYLVTIDGYMKSYGSEIYVVGVYDTKEKAEEIKRKLIDKNKVFPTVTKMIINETEKIHKSEWDPNEKFTNHYLGGYIE